MIEDELYIETAIETLINDEVHTLTNRVEQTKRQKARKDGATTKTDPL